MRTKPASASSSRWLLPLAPRRTLHRFATTNARPETNAGNGLGGGLYNDGTSTLTVTGSTVTDNQAIGGQGSPAGDAFGGCFYTGLAAILSLDSYTLLHTEDNQPDDISGPYSLLP